MEIEHERQEALRRQREDLTRLLAPGRGADWGEFADDLGELKQDERLVVNE
jgi:hypothetical protein